MPSPPNPLPDPAEEKPCESDIFANERKELARDSDEFAIDFTIDAARHAGV